MFFSFKLPGVYMFFRIPPLLNIVKAHSIYRSARDAKERVRLFCVVVKWSIKRSNRYQDIKLSLSLWLEFFPLFIKMRENHQSTCFTLIKFALCGRLMTAKKSSSVLRIFLLTISLKRLIFFSSELRANWIHHAWKSSSSFFRSSWQTKYHKFQHWCCTMLELVVLQEHRMW